MDEILKKLLESDLLSAETKAEIKGQWETATKTFLAEERTKIEVEVRSALTKEFVTARDELAAKVEKRIDEALAKEFEELKADIEKFRDLEVEYAEKLVDEKEKLAQQLGEQLNQLVDKIDAFLEVRLDEEMSELREDIESVKKLEFGRKIFEAIEAEYKTFRKADLSEVEQKLAETSDALADAETKIAEMERARLSEARTAKLEELLKPLTGNAREQMKIILSNVATERLDEAFKSYIGRVLKESVVPAKDESKATDKKDDKAPLVEGTKPAGDSKLVTGNEPKAEDTPTAAEDTKTNDQISRIRKLAGLSR